MKNTYNQQGLLLLLFIGWVNFLILMNSQRKNVFLINFIDYLIIIKLGLIIFIPIGDIINIDPCLNIDLLSKKNKIENFPIQIFSI